jgi:PadR family transcriptional regulator PadR
MHRDEIPPGTLYLLILKALARSGELHGFEIARMLIEGWVKSKWGVTAGNRRARYYRLTPLGRVEVSEFNRVLVAIRRAIQTVSEH